MNKLINILTRSLMLAILILPITTHAQGTFNEEGIVLKINEQSVNIADGDFRLLPTTRFFLFKGQKGKLADIKKGDYASARIVKIDNKLFVETLRLVKKPTQNEEDN